MGRIFGFEDLTALGILSPDGVLSISETVKLEKKLWGDMRTAKVMAYSAYVGETAPKIHFSLTVEGQEKPLYHSHSYRMGREGDYSLQEWRTPPAFLPSLIFKVEIDIPEGTTLYIKNFTVAHEADTVRWNSDGPRHNAHLGFFSMAPNNTMPAFELAAASGFSSCICVPKWTKDNVLVCIHDDTINKTARDKDGNKEEEPIYVWDKTYEELCEYEYGSYKNEIYKGTKMPLLEDFFALCARTGMNPMFSTHPGLSEENWKRVREMLERLGILKKFHIKSFGFGVLQNAYKVFGSDIDGYTWDNDTVDAEKIEKFKVFRDAMSAPCRLGIEIQFKNYTEELARMITSEGFFAAAWNINRRDYDEYERLISFGVTEFTEDNHCSMGLNF